MKLELYEKHIQKLSYSITITMDLLNKRVRVDDYLGQFSSCVKEALQASEEMAAEKLIFKARIENVDYLLEHGFIYEAKVDRYFLGSDCYFFVKYFKDERRNSLQWTKEDQILDDVIAIEDKVEIQEPPNLYTFRKASESDAQMLADLYQSVFKVYPTPMNDPFYIKKCMNHHTIFFMYLYQGKVVSAASAEINRFYHNAEITDCATLPEHRQVGLLKGLIVLLEKELLNQEIYCVYSIARALSFGMNAALHQHHYHYRGRLANNCYIFDQLEDMNMWVKQLV